MSRENNIKIVLTVKEIELLEEYSLFLEKHAYMDTDWRSEEPTSINHFLKEKSKTKK